VNKMSFSSEVKEELSKLNIFGNDEILKSELFGYLLSANSSYANNNVEFITENEFNIERIYKILFKLKIDYDPDIKGKTFKAIVKKDDLDNLFENFNFSNDKDIVRGAFLGAGSVTEPNKRYHLEIIFKTAENAELIKKLCEMKDIKIKIMQNNEKTNLYLKDGEEISKFLAYIGANKSVINFEETRVFKDMKNNVNRRVNCETANLNKIVDASLEQVNDIKYIISKNKFEKLTPEMKAVAQARLEHPEESLKDLGKYLDEPIGKSGINYRLKKIHEFAEDLRKEEE